MRPAVPLYWRATPAECAPFFRNPVSSMMPTPARVRQVVDDIGLQGVPARVRRPGRAAQQVLEAVGVGLALHLGQLPAVLARRRAHQALDVGQGPAVRAAEAKDRPQALRHLRPVRGPGRQGLGGQGFRCRHGRRGRGGCGHGDSRMTVAAVPQLTTLHYNCSIRRRRARTGCFVSRDCHDPLTIGAISF